MKNFIELKEKLEQLNQLHLIKYWNDLNENEQNKFLEHLNNIDIEEAINLYKKTLTNNKINININNDIQPIPPSQFESEEYCNEEKLNNYQQLGLQAISRNEIGVLLMAGGQGTRLGVEYPKGMYSVDLPSGKSLFQLQAERIQRIEQLAYEATGKNGTITWYIMTSGPTDLQTNEFLKKHNFFGLNPDNVVQFKQGLLPCFDFDGRIVLEKKDLVALAPDGNGGIYRALHKNGIINDMKRRGIKYIHAHSVDNILIKVADPIFIGYCINKNSDCGAKVVSKLHPNEPLGVVCKVNNKFQVVEYTEITQELANLRDEFGNLVYNAGNICNHFFTTQFLIRIIDNYENNLKLHIAKKKIPFINNNGITVTPSHNNGIKIEKFIFDVFEFSDNFVTWQVPRFSDFSALKNPNHIGIDCPQTAKDDLLKLHKIYVEKSGGCVDDIVEISPLLSYAGENLENYVKNQRFDKCTILSAPKEKSTKS